MVQTGILEPVPAAARYVSFRLAPGGGEPAAALTRLARLPLGAGTVVGLGPSLVARLGGGIDGLHELPALAGPGVSSPSTPTALWCWLRGDDPGLLLQHGRALAAVLAPAFVLEEAVGAFRHEGGRDLSGYEDGTENPRGAAALEAALVHGRGPGLDGGPASSPRSAGCMTWPRSTP